MSTRGVIISKGKKPEYYYIRSDADMFPEFSMKYGHSESVRSNREYLEHISKSMSKKEPGYNDSKTKKFLREHGVDPNYIQKMDEIEGHNYLTSQSAHPEYVYEMEEGNPHNYQKYKVVSRWDCGPNEEYVSPYVKKDGTYVNGFCRKVTDRDREQDRMNLSRKRRR